MGGFVLYCALVRAFSFIDKILEFKEKESLTALYTLKGGEEFLKDHFSAFPVMPGVLLLEALSQAAAALLALSQGLEPPFYRLKEARDVRFGQFVRPGSDLEIFVRWLHKEADADLFEGRIHLVKPVGAPAAARALSARIALLPAGRG